MKPFVTRRSRHDDNIWVSVYKDCSGGFFSLADMVPQPLRGWNTLIDTALLWQEYEDLLRELMEERDSEREESKEAT